MNPIANHVLSNIVSSGYRNSQLTGLLDFKKDGSAVSKDKLLFVSTKRGPKCLGGLGGWHEAVDTIEGIERIESS